MNKHTLIDKLTSKQAEYDLTKVPNEFTYDQKLEIICHKKDTLGREHGSFFTTFGKLVTRGDGCPYCSGRRMDKELFVADARKIHGDDYSYDKFVFEGKRKKSIIHCNKHNIDFEQAPCKHLVGQGCPICRYEKSAKSKTMTTEDFVQKAKTIHGDKYDYSASKYIRNDEKLEIICHKQDENGEEHGVFLMSPENHLSKHHPQGCPKCARENLNKDKASTKEDFIEKAIKIHGNKYDYSDVEYVNNSTNVLITCPTHGVFEQRPDNHLMGAGCPSCACHISQPENEIFDFVKEIYAGAEQGNRTILDGKELDIYVPSKKIAIEYDGLRWHSEEFGKDEKYHLKKTEECAKQGIQLIHIFEDEWLEKKEIVKSRLRNILGITENTIYARKCYFMIVKGSVAQKFLEDNHIQGRCKGMYHYGLFYDGELVSLMTFGKMRQQRKYHENYDSCYELLRFCSKLNTNVVGAAGKLLKMFLRDLKPSEVVSYADKRWSQGNLYKQLGFEHTHDSRPNYFYVVAQRRENRFKYRKGELVKDGYDPNKSEREIMLERGIYRIYDCGTMVFKLMP